MLGGQTTTGAVLSLIVTGTSQLLVLPEPSVAVTVMVVEPPLMLPKATPAGGFCVSVTTEQLSASSVMPGSTFGTTSLQLDTVIGAGQVKVGAVTSRTVTSATQMLVLPAPSVTVSVTLFSPRFEQLKLVLLAANVSVAGQLSVDPPLICAVVMDAVPAAFRSITTSLQTAVGACSSFTVTVKAQVAVLPAASVPV
jgi:hypothetical protein